MTIIKQRAVTENGHQRNLRAYINDDKKVLFRDSQNMDGCTNIKRLSWRPRAGASVTIRHREWSETRRPVS